ncbi:hypothetical protein Bca52824_023767 [Brassica carinata]|uniref:Uncharacterized protein n=1 Tax=Brassica carinata TaxID=52824 RepID=A0A8X7VJR6_BRACI|nr:hypothetical protein Bca52824_023767 [Brassica carinata]
MYGGEVSKKGNHGEENYGTLVMVLSWQSSRQDDRVFYFPQGHIEQEAFCDYQIRPDYSNFEVYAILEGSFVFPELPLMRIEGPVGVSLLSRFLSFLLIHISCVLGCVCRKAFRLKTMAVWLWNLQLIRQAGRRVKNNNISCLQVTGRWKKAEVAEANSKEHYKFAMSKDRFSRKKPQQTYLPTIPVVKLIPSGEFPECEIQQHKDEVAAHWTRLIGGEASCLCVGGEASEGGSEEKLVV